MRTEVIELGREKAGGRRRYSKDEIDGRLRFSSVMGRDSLWRAATPPPRPERRGLAM